MNFIMWNLIEMARSLKRQGKFLFVFEAYRLFTIFSNRFKKSCRDLVCFTSVKIRLPWAYAYYKMGERLVHELFLVIDSDDYQPEIADQVYHQALELLERACQLRPNYVEAARSMYAMAILTGRTDAWIAAQHRSIEYQENRAKLAGLSKHNFRILASGPIFSTIGNTLTLDAWIKAGILGLRPPWRSLILVDPKLKGRASNQCLLDYFEPYIDFVENPIELSQLHPLASELLAHHDYYPYYFDKKALPYSHSAAVWIQTEWDKQGREPLLQLKDEHRKRGWDMLEKMGVPKDSWFVTTHVRESGFKSKESYRDSDISDYFEAYKEITARGGWVIRLGDASMKPLPPMPNVFDYALSSAKSDCMDVFLLGAARFMIGTSSGPTTVSYAFGVPVAMTNNLPTVATYLGRKDLFLPRLMCHLDDRRFLHLEELMTEPYSMAAWDTIFTNVLGVDNIPNTPEEIAELVIEMLNKLDGTLAYTEEEEGLQQRFKSLTAEREVMIGLPGFEVQCRLGRHFLNQHQHLLG